VSESKEVMSLFVGGLTAIEPPVSGAHGAIILKTFKEVKEMLTALAVDKKPQEVMKQIYKLASDCHDLAKTVEKSAWPRLVKVGTFKHAHLLTERLSSY
jgi:hypothetical protein